MLLTLQVILESSCRVRNGSAGLRVERRGNKYCALSRKGIRAGKIEPLHMDEEGMDCIDCYDLRLILETIYDDSLHGQVFLLYLFILLQLPRDPLKDNCSFAHHIDVISRFQGEW
jgi:hypothetical protein